MDILDTPLGDEITRVINAAQPPGLTYTDAVILAGGEELEVYKVLNLDEVCDYRNQYAPELSIVLLVPAGTFAYRIQPHRNNLEVTIRAAPSTQSAVAPGQAEHKEFETFRAILQDDTSDATLENNGQRTYDEMTLNMSDFRTIKLQLFSKAMEEFNMRSFGGCPRRTKITDLVKIILMGESNRATLENAYMPKGIDMVPPLDVVPREHYPIPHGMPSTDAVGFLHKECGGIYSAGLSYFFQRDYWHVFPTYDNTRFEQASRQLVIVQIPGAKMPSLEYTYLQKGKCLTILATGDTIFDDPTDSRAMVEGNGVRFTDAAGFFDEPVVAEGNRATFARASKNSEYVGTRRATGLNNVVQSDRRITANKLYEASKLAARNGAHIQVMWENANPALLYPGMQVKIMYMRNGTVATRYACLIGMHTSTAWTGKGLLAGKHVRTVALNLFAQLKDA